MQYTCTFVKINANVRAVVNLIGQSAHMTINRQLQLTVTNNPTCAGLTPTYIPRYKILYVHVLSAQDHTHCKNHTAACMLEGMYMLQAKLQTACKIQAPIQDILQA